MTESTEHSHLMNTYAEIAMKASKLVSQSVRRNLTGKELIPTDEVGIAQTFMDLSKKLLSSPERLLDMQMSMMWDHFSLWQNSLFRIFGLPTQAVKQPESGDRRFKHELWENHLLFDFIKQSYLITSSRIRETIDETNHVDEAERSKVNFFSRQFIDALSPTNFALTNPQVIQEIMQSGGKNLLHGLNNLLRDIDHKGQLRVRMTDPTAFQMGVNVATTQGKVVFQNELFQLLQFNPSTEKTFKRPLLIIAPWINKYYILDLTEKNSFIKWCVDQGHTVFTISWVNPDEKLAAKSFENYLIDGAYTALKQVLAITGEETVNLVSYCIGGTLTMTLLAYMASQNDYRASSAVFFTTMLDFSEPGELGVYLGEDTINALIAKMEKRGYLDGAEMATTFNTLRQNDLIWSFVINNYLMGKQPFPFDLLFWNSDSTRMPAAMHAYYLRNMYLYNKLVQPGALQMGGVPIDIGQVKTPCYFLSTIEDHIAPWKSTYMGARLPTGPVKFVLGGSGHIAGVVNPPAAKKYGYWTNETSPLPESPDEYLQNATKHDGSWWPDWQNWVTEVIEGGNIQIPARKPGDNGVTILEDAPGSYAKFRLDMQPAPGSAPATSTAVAAKASEAAVSAGPIVKAEPAASEAGPEVAPEAAQAVGPVDAEHTEAAVESGGESGEAGKHKAGPKYKGRVPRKID